MLWPRTDVNIFWGVRRNVRLVQMNETLKGLAVQRRVEQIAIRIGAGDKQSRFVKLGPCK